jgi:hypothetical protein
MQHARNDFTCQLAGEQDGENLNDAVAHRLCGFECPNVVEWGW